MLRIENVQIENPGIASGSIMTLQDIQATPLKSTVNKEQLDAFSNPYRRSIEASNKDTKRTNQSEYLKNPDGNYNGNTNHERFNVNEIAEVQKIQVIDQ